MHFFTSVTTCYIPKARVLAKTLKKYNKNSIIHLVISDNLPENFSIENEDFDFIWDIEDFIKIDNIKKWTFIHSVVELCTAVKGAAALHILKVTGTDKLIYLDPDIAVFDSLEPLEKMLDQNSVLFTPHVTYPSTEKKDIIINELSALKYGIYNFGFFAIKNDEKGLQYLNWWNDRLMNFCFDDIPNGMFTDQKWGDIAPGFFDFIKIIYDPEYNVATWNLYHRTISGSEKDGWFVNGRPLRFFHFTGFDSGAHKDMLSLYAKPGDPVWALSNLYSEWINDCGQQELGKIPYRYNNYTNGKKINKSERLLFKNNIYLYNKFDDPYSNECYLYIKQIKKINTSIKSIILNKYKYKILKFISFGHKKDRYKSIYNDIKINIRNIQNFIDNNLS